ncbi:uncharacterized protein DSM5745_06951 [Aspergillus mulundensis]|uniref:LDB19 N-terminal domain-containing protein n=1 Tax=Aspergillus mulundensis TaxID=1810919 RepID=A0A3D8RJR9_9EURO|nr:hypothetical protein DSM5745_06951 [Aspergillus mulundensis]RDW74289.1 hypothetical protein DSM5745_06951 [Aspergillus mulundensis]
MNDSRVRLTVPDTHLHIDGESNAPIPGSISITSLTPSPSTAHPEIIIELARLVKPMLSNTRSPEREKERGSKNFCIWKRKAARARAQVQHLPCRIPEAQMQTIARCNIWHAPEKISQNTHESMFNFSLAVSGDIPPTADTVLGSVSYIVTATVRFASAASVQESQPIKIHRLAASSPISYIRSYPGSPVVTELRITPQPAKREYGQACKTTRAQHHYDLRWRARSTIMPGARDSEVKCVVVKELRWRVEETVKFISLFPARHGNESEDRNGRKMICHHQHTQNLCHGQQTGRWVASRCQVEDEDCLIEIPCHLDLPSAVNNIDASSDHHDDGNDGEALAIAVDHQLHLEVVTGEDTFHRETGDLVERKPCVRSYKAAFALPVCGVADDDLLNQLRAANALPKYEASYPALPEYKVIS